MTTKITGTGYQNRPAQVGTGSAVQRPRDVGSQPTATATPTNSIRITDQARQLAALEQAIQSLPAVNEARVAEIRLAIQEGRYHVEPERIAEKLLRMEHEFMTHGAEK